MRKKNPNKINFKICILTSIHRPFDIRIFQKEAKSLAFEGYDVTIIAQHDKDEVVDGIRVIPLSMPKNRIVRMSKTVWQIYKKALKIEADIYHFHDPELILVGWMLKRYGRRVIYDVHEDVPRQILSKEYIPFVFRKPISMIIEIIEGIFAKRFDGVVTATPFINSRFLELGANAKNVNNFPLVSELYTRDNQWEKKEKAACYVGGIDRLRGAIEMVDAIAKTKYGLMLAGDIESSIETSLKQMPGWRQVKFFGYVKRDCIKKTMARSMVGLVLLHPIISFRDALPIKMFEYMSSGLPVIASNFPLWREIIEGAECGLCVDPLDPEKIASAIQWIIKNPDEAMMMGKNGRRAVEERFNWGEEEKKLSQLYKKILQQVYTYDPIRLT